MSEERAAKYTQEEINALGAKGHAFKNPDGHYSFPIDDEEDLDDAIHAVGRSGAEHDSVRKYIIGRAEAMGLKDKIPENWNSDGSIDETKATRADTETCPTCDGTGKIKEGTTTCPTCSGTGDIPAESSNAAPDVQVTREPPGAFRGGMLQVREERVPVRREFELREVPNGTGGTNLRFTGFACVTDVRYEMEDWLGVFGETVSKGAFKKTLSESADAAFLLNHQGMTLARTKSGTLKLSEVTEPGLSPVIGVTGLHSEALLDPTNPQVAAMRSAVDRGDLDEMSFAFRVMRQEWNETYDERYINEVSVDKGDVSLVNYGANPHTGGTVALRQRILERAPDLSTRALAVIAEATAELRTGKTISVDTASKLAGIHDHLDAMGDAADGIRGIIEPLIAMSASSTENDDGEGEEDLSIGQAMGLFREFDFRAERVRLEASRYWRAA